MGRLVRRGAGAENHGEQVEDQDPSRLGSREAALKARASATRVVLISGYISPDLERRARDRGVDSLVRKPFQVDSLIQIVRAALT